LTILSLSRSLA